MKNKYLKYIIILIAILTVFILSNSSNNNDANIVLENTTVINKTSFIDKTSVIDTFSEQYNAISNYKITNLVNFDVHDKNSDHYRVEFRLNAFNNAIGKTGTIENSNIDLIDYSSNIFQNLRIYTTIPNQEVMKIFFNTTINILNPEISNSELEKIYSNINKFEQKNFSFNNINGYITLNNNNEYEIFIDYQEKINK